MKKILLLSIIAFLFGSCTYKFVEPEQEEVVNPDDTVSFQTQVIPIFNDNDKCTACHKPGGTRPDLTPENAYNEIYSMNLVVPEDPAASKIYYYIEPASDSHTWEKYTDNESQTVSLWVEQGALNN